MAGVSAAGVAIVSVGAVFAYGAISGKSPLTAALYLVQGKDPKTVPKSTAIGTSVSAAPSVTGGGGMGVIDQSMVDWGFSRAGRAGALGNIQVESAGTFSPTITNPEEGAIGIAQWEGGRRTELQSFAASMGLKETDLAAQLAFMKHELDTTRLDVYGYMRLASDPSSAAAYWDEFYEGSSGQARQQREDNAVRIYATLSEPAVSVGPDKAA